MPADALHGGYDNNLNVIRLTECPPASTTCEKSGQMKMMASDDYNDR